MTLFPSMTKQCDLRVTKLFYSQTATARSLQRDDDEVDVSITTSFCVQPRRFSNWQSISSINNLYLSKHSKQKYDSLFYNLIVRQLCAIADTRKWQQNGEKQARVDLTKLEWSCCWTDAGIILHLCLSVATLCSCVPCPLPWATTKALRISGGVCVYSLNVSTKLSDRDCETYIELRPVSIFLLVRTLSPEKQFAKQENFPVWGELVKEQSPY